MQSEFQLGDIYIQEAQAERFALWRNTEAGWDYIGLLSKQEADVLVKPMEFLRDTPSGHRFYRPAASEGDPHA